MSQAFVKLQNALPQHQLSRLIGKLAESRASLVRKPFIHLFARAYGVNLDEAEHKSLDAYASFNDFFTRALAPDARPLPADADAIVCPADGAVSQLGAIEDGRLLQAKGHAYALESLAGALAPGFRQGRFVTVYLAPRDYHRVHLPFGGKLEDTLAIPGALFSVNAATEHGIEGLFCRNERLVCRFSTPFGPMLVVLVGAMIVASIETVWDGPASPYRETVRTAHGLELARGAEIGRFLLGSTVICCFPPERVALDSALRPGAQVRMGQAIATLRRT